MKFRIVDNAWWMFWAAGMCVWPFLWFKKGSLHIDRLYRHELEHCYQAKELGRLKFYFTYILKFLRYGYWNHPFEIKARRASLNPLTDIEIAWRAARKVVL